MLKSNKILLLTIVFLALFTQIFAQNQTAEDYFNQGVSFLQAQKFTEALEAFRKSVQLDAKHPATHANIGAVLVALNRASESVAPLREAVKLEPGEPSFRSV